MTMFLEFADELQDSFFEIMAESRQTTLIEQFRRSGHKSEARMWEKTQKQAQKTAQEAKRADAAQRKLDEATSKFCNDPRWI